MKPVFKEAYSMDKKCYEKYLLTEDILMEHAANTMAEIIKNSIKKGSVVNIVSGPGNNGADGITLARILTGEYKINLYLPLEAKSQMAKLQLERFRLAGGEISKEYHKCDCLVDAVFGSGLKRDLSEDIIYLIKKMSNQDALKIACDIPTGIDENGNLRPVAFKADITVTMGVEKISLYSDKAKDYAGKIIRADLGVSFNKYKDSTDYYVLEKEDLSLPFRKKQNTHKGSFGHLGVLAGSKSGAGIIAASAALNFGAGLVSIIENEKCKIKNVPYEIMKSGNFDRCNSLAFGMGLGDCFDEKLPEICKLDVPMVIDADMFYKSIIKEFLKKKNIVLTPHPKEFASFLTILDFGKYDTNDVQKNRFNLAKEFSEKYPKVVLLLKGANKIIAFNGKIYIDPNGDAALAKGGSGDVLAGMIGALLAQGYHPLRAAIQASLAHSAAGNFEPNYSLTPGKLIQRLEDIGKN